MGQRDGLEVPDEQMQTITYRRDKQRGPTVQHRKLYSISCDKPLWKEYDNEYIHAYIPESLPCTAVTHHKSTLRQ